MMRAVDDVTGASLFYCEACPAGTHNPSHGQTSPEACRACEGKGYVPDAARAACVTCPPGFSSPHAGGGCAPCAAGTASPDGRACVPCPAGTYAAGRDACEACPRGTYGGGAGLSRCAACPAGTYAAEVGSLTCSACPAERFAADTGSVECAPRRRQCRAGEYVLVRSSTPERDNECAACRPCPEDAFTVAATSNAWASGGGGVCPGNLTDPGYRCVRNDWKEGQYLSMQERAGADNPWAIDDGEGGVVMASNVGAPCTQLGENPAAAALMGYVRGPTFACYVGCKYGLRAAGGDTYSASPGVERPRENIFLPRALAFASALCVPCPLSRCGMDGIYGLYRPAVTAECGPPCLLPSHRARCAESTERNSGCIERCDPPPANAWATGGSAVLGGRGACPWSCRTGYHLSDNGTECLHCGDVSVCDADSVPVPFSLCTPELRTTGGFCRACPRVEGGVPARWIGDGACEYNCTWGYFSLEGGGCSPCTILNNVSCGVGTFRDVATCRRTGRAPQCVPCSTDQRGGQGEPLVSFTTPGAPADADNCSGACIAGYHTLRRAADSVYIAGARPVAEIRCRACAPGDAVPCHGRCSMGFFRNRAVASDLTPGACVRCTLSMECGAGQYAPPCNGTNTADFGCQACPPPPPNRVFVPYHSGDDTCPTACAPNHMEWPGTRECIPCGEYARRMGCAEETRGADAYAAGQPRPCDFIYSHWNATPGAPWWDAPRYTPSFLQGALAANRRQRRAGLCWACPTGTGLVDQELCAMLPGFGEVGPTVIERLPIPSWGPDIYLAFQEPRPSPVGPVGTVSEYGQRRRMLLQLAPSATSATAAPAVTIAPCPIAHYNDRARRRCALCPAGTSTYGVGATSLADCKCMPGHFNASSADGGCAACPAETFRGAVRLFGARRAAPNPPRAVTGQASSSCAPCPEGETTFGKVASTACACVAGRRRAAGGGACVPCPENTFCYPCWDTQTDCRDEVNQVDCFRHGVSPPGSTSVLNCTCASGLARLLRPRSDPALPGSYYCLRPPPHAVYDPILQRVACPAGWNSTWDMGQLVACTLCFPGFFFDRQRCTPCPVGTYTALRDTMDACTPCPASLTTRVAGASSAAACGCPPPLVSSAEGGCKPCAADEFPVDDRCQRCPPNAVMQPGRAECACGAGHQRDAANACVPCPVGTFSAHASNAPCTPCPQGSTTAAPGAERRGRCGESAALCLSGYAYIGPGLCRPQELLQRAVPPIY